MAAWVIMKGGVAEHEGALDPGSLWEGERGGDCWDPFWKPGDLGAGADRDARKKMGRGRSEKPCDRERGETDITLTEWTREGLSVGEEQEDPQFCRPDSREAQKEVEGMQTRPENRGQYWQIEGGEGGIQP